MKNRGLGKKAQEAVSNFGVTGIVLIVFLVIVVLGIWYVNSSWVQVSDQIPKNAAIIANACSAVATDSGLTPYCLQFREADKNIYTTCDYAKKYNIVILDSDNSNASVVRMASVCSEVNKSLNNEICNACNTTRGQFYQKPRVEVNGKKCSEWIGELSCRNYGESSVAKESWEEFGITG